MDAHLQLSPDDFRVIDAILASLSKRDKLSLSLDYLLQKWYKFVIDVEEGYDDTIFDYTNSLGKRDFLEELVRQVPKPLQSNLLRSLQPWDIRFEEATKGIEEAVLPSTDKTVVLGWWWYRVPKKLKEPIYDPTHWNPFYT